MSTIANAKVAHNYNRYNGYFFGCLLSIGYDFKKGLTRKGKSFSIYR